MRDAVCVKTHSPSWKKRGDRSESLIGENSENVLGMVDRSSILKRRMSQTGYTDPSHELITEIYRVRS